MPSWVGGLYDGAAALGRAISWVKLAVALFIACAVCAVGVFMHRMASRHTKTARATVDRADCKAMGADEGGGQRCALDIHYVAGGEVVTAGLVKKAPAAIEQGSQLEVAFDPAAPGAPLAKEAPAVLRTGAYAASSCACCIAAVSILSFALVQRYKLAAAGDAAGTVLGLVLNRGA